MTDKIRMPLVVLLAGVLTTSTAAAPKPGDMSRTDRYFLSASGKPVFLLGYCDWASIEPDHYICWPARYMDMIDRGSRGGRHNEFHLKDTLHHIRGITHGDSILFRYH